MYILLIAVDYINIVYFMYILSIVVDDAYYNIIRCAQVHTFKYLIYITNISFKILPAKYFTKFET